MKKMTFCFCTWIACHSVQSQINPSWVKFPTPANYQNYDVKEVSTAVDSVGNIYTAASMDDTLNTTGPDAKAIVVKYNSAGVKQWMSVYPNPYLYTGSYAASILVDKAGNSYMCGYGGHDGTNHVDMLVIKYDNTGAQQWARYWDGGQGQDDRTTCASFDAAGNIIIAGYANDQGTNGDDLSVVKYSPSGSLLWSYQYNNAAINGEDRAFMVTSDAVNNIFVTGTSFGSVARDIITLKLNSTGAIQWINTIPHGSSVNDDKSYGLVVDALGNAYITGEVDDWITVKYDPAGNTLWTNHYTANALNRYSTKKVKLDKHNHVIVAGDAFISTVNQSDLVVNQLNSATGTSLWSVTYNYGGIDHLSEMALDTSGKVYLAGYFDGPAGTDMSTTVVSSGGLVIWHTTYTNPYLVYGTDLPYQLVLDKDQNILVSGVAETRSNSTSSVDVIILKYGALVTGIDEKSDLSAIRCYPNPARETITLEMTEPHWIGSTISILTLTGQALFETQVESLHQTFNLPALASGMYLLKIGTTGANGIKKLVIE